MTPPTTTATRPSALSSSKAGYDELLALVRESKLLGSTAQLLGWDQETMMPEGGVEFRSRQLAQLARMTHDLAVKPRIGELLVKCESDRNLTAHAESDTAANLREIRRDYERETKLPASLVEEIARVSSIAQHEWAEARKQSDFKRFRPHLTKIIDLMRAKADCLGYSKPGGEPWDGLADEYEPGMTAQWVESIFTPLRARLKSLLDQLLGSKTPPSNAFNEFALDVDAQEKFGRFASQAIGFDYTRGRLDRSTHPFCSGTHCNDIRLTSRYNPTCLNDGLGSVLHESGHGIYEQGLRFEHVGTPLGESVSLGIHESQSRMWENQVGRSRAFWTWAKPQLSKFFGSGVDRFSIDELYGAANVVEPGFIRVDADEATYNMHIMIRFEMERGILKGDINVDDIPALWNAKYKDYLGLAVPDDRRGCLQDIHWSMASMGYFPTYTLGNLYCAQFFEKAMADIPNLSKQFEKGEFGDLKRWLNENIHRHGRRYLPQDLCRRVTGQPLTADPLMRHLEGKLRPIYRV